MKLKTISSAAIALALGVGSAFIATAPASAEAQTSSASCSVLSWSATGLTTNPGADEIFHIIPGTPGQPYIAATEGTPAVYKDVVVIDQEAVAPIEGVPAVYRDVVVIDVAGVEEVSHTEYEFRHVITGKKKWNSDANWNSNGNPNSLGYIKTGNTQTVIDVEGVDEVSHVEQELVSPEIPAVPGQDEVSHIEQELVSEAVEGLPGQPFIAATEDEKVVDSEAIPADETPNTIVVTVNDEVVHEADFGTEDTGSHDFADETVANDWTVEVTAYDDELSFTDSGTSTPCEVPVVVVPERPADVVTTEVQESTDCVADFVATITYTTTTGWILNTEKNVWEAGEPVTTSHGEWREATDAECPPVVTPPVVKPPVIVTPPAVVTPPAAPVAAAPVAVVAVAPVAEVASDEALASTGANAAGYAGLAGLLTAAGLVLVALRKRVKA